MLFFRIAASLPSAMRYFEPTAADAQEIAGQKDAVVKILLHPGWFEHVDPASFDKRVLIVRDPRDTLVSCLLYWIVNTDIYRSREKLREFLSVLRRKEEYPRSVPLTEILRMYDKEIGGSFLEIFCAQLAETIVWHSRWPDAYTIRYRDLLEWRVKELERHVGVRLSRRADLLGYRVARTKTYGTWRHWFTPGDVALFQPRFEAYMRLFGFEDDWMLAKRPAIPKEHASWYVRRLVLSERAHDRAG